MRGFQQTKTPYIIPTFDNRSIEEYIGLAATGQIDLSVSKMVAQPQWSESYQTPDFDEILIMTKGKQLVEVNGERIELCAGQSLMVKKGSRVQYSNPYSEANEYWSVCIPAYTVETVNKEEYF